MPRYQIKVNTAGSWANLVSCPRDRLDAVKAACEALAAVCNHGIAFKAVDAASGDIVARFNNKPHGWYSICRPTGRLAGDPGVMDGTNRTTSGAIGQP